MPHGKGSGHGNLGKPEHVDVVKPGTKSGEIGGLKNIAKENPRSGDKPRSGKPPHKTHKTE